MRSPRLPDDELQAALGRLVASELVFQRGMPPDAVYSFKHALVQDAAHGSLLRSSRQQLHAQIAEALEAQSSEMMDAQPEIAAPETGHAFGRARELWEQLGSPSEFLQIPHGQSVYHALRGEFDRAKRLDEDLLRLSHQRNDSAGLVLGHLSSGINLMFAGRFALSRSHLEEALAVYDPICHRSLVHQAGIHSLVSSQAFLGIVLFCLGFSDQALAQSSAAIAEARGLAHPPSLASTLRSAPLCSRSSETTQSWTSERASWSRWRPSRVSPPTVRGERFFGAGSRSKMAMWRRECLCCAAVRRRIAPPGRRRGRPIISPSWPRYVRSHVKLTTV